MCRVDGPVVQSVDAVFATDWYMETGEHLEIAAPGPALPDGDVACQAIPSGPGFAVENNLQIFLMLLYSARERIIIEVEADYRRASTRLTSEEWAKQPRRTTTLDGLARLTSSLQ